MTITTPLALILLFVIPFIMYLGWPRNRFRRLRDSISLVLRVSIVTLLVLALAGVQVAQSADRLAVVFLVDVSDSMGGDAQERAIEYIREALPEMRPDDIAGVIAFGADAQVARSMSSARELSELRTIPQTSNTNIAAAIRLGLALFPNDAARRIVVLSDGQPTIGDTQGAAQLADAAGVEISYVPFTRPSSDEVQLRDVTVPTVLDENQDFDMTLTIESEEDTRAMVTVRAAGQIVHREEANLRQGVNNYTLGLRSGANALVDWDVALEPVGDDGFYQNNQLAAFSRVEGSSRLLVINGDETSEDEVRFIAPALTESGFVVDIATPGEAPIGMAGLAQYEAVILVNVSAADLSNSRMSALESYVADLGGGLIVVGGPQSYGAGGYFQTPLEDALPVEVQIRDQQRLPQLTIAYIIDRSGSMGVTSTDGIPHIDLAKEAIIRSIDFLQPTDRAAVASFDTNSYWIAEFQDVLDRRNLQRLVSTLRASGGTSIMAGMRLVADDIDNEESEVKHIILLTDGGAEPSGLVELTRRLNEDSGVTTSVISISGYQAPFLQDMADAGQGNYHNVTDAASIPQIFSLETVLASRTYIQEDTFTPSLTAVHPIMQNIPALPELQGYVATSSRETSQVILRGPEPFRDPILAAWQYGLGRSVAFTSDATARWGQNWVSWDDFSRFWSQTVRWTITEGASNNLETRIEMEDEQARIIVDARDNEGAFLNGLNLQGSVVFDVTEGGERIQLRQVAPGRYEATFTPEDEGAYFLRVTNQDGTAVGSQSGALQLNQTTGWVMSYSREYEVREVDNTLLESIANLTDGADLSATPEAVFEHNLAARNASVPIWPWLLLTALMLLPLDIAVRRLLVTQSDLRRLSAWMRERLTPSTSEETVERMSTLRQARDRARSRSVTATPIERPSAASSISQLRRRRDESTGDAPESESTAPTPRPAPSKPSTPHPLSSAPKPEAPAPSRPKPWRPDPPAPSPGGGNIGARLLKRRRSEDDDDGEK